MIRVENIDARCKRTYSDLQLKIRKVGTEEVYDEAIDLIDKYFEYEETDEPIYINEELENQMLEEE